MALYASRPGKGYLVIAVQEDEEGFEIKESSRGARCPCGRFIRTLLERGVPLPQAAELTWDPEAFAYTARLTLEKEKPNGEN